MNQKQRRFHHSIQKLQKVCCSLLAIVLLTGMGITFSAPVSAGIDYMSGNGVKLVSISTSPIGSPDYEEENDFKVTATYFAKRTNYATYTTTYSPCPSCGGAGGHGGGSGDSGGGSGSGEKVQTGTKRVKCGTDGFTCRPACDGWDYNITWPGGKPGTGVVTQIPGGGYSENWGGATIGSRAHRCDCYKEVPVYGNADGGSGGGDSGDGEWTDCSNCDGSGSISHTEKHPPKEPPSQVTVRSRVKIDGVVVATKTVTINMNTTVHTSDEWTKEGTATVEWIVNAGENIGEKEVTVDVGGGGTPDTEKSTDINVKPACNLTVKYVDPVARYTAGTTVISSFMVQNHNTELGLNVRPKHKMDVVFRAYDNEGNLLHTQTKKNVIVPKNRQNIVYFEWTVPSDLYFGYLQPITNIRLECEVNTGYQKNTKGVNEDDYTDNKVNVGQEVLNNYVAETYNPTYEEKALSDIYMENLIGRRDGTQAWHSIVGQVNNNLSWSEWVWNNGYVKKDYSVSLYADSYNGLDPTIQSTEHLNDDDDYPMLRMRSGYGVTAKVEAWIKTSGSPPKEAYTGAQSANMYFPEFNYSFGFCDWPERQWDDDDYISSFHRSLELTDNTDGVKTFQYYKNRFSVTRGDNDELVHDNRRVHYTPLWFPDTNTRFRDVEPTDYDKNVPYQPVPVVYDAWTPVGMLTIYDTGINSIEIVGNVYDDWYTSYK